MGSAVLAVRVVLAAVFVIAATGKLFDLAGSRRSLADFGVPARLASVLGTLLPFAELAVAAALVVRPSAQAGGIAALVLLVTFIGGMSNALRAGQTPDCHCFGAIHSAPVGWSQIVRNAGLAALAGFTAVAGPGDTIDAWVEDHSAAVLVAVATTAAAIVLAILAFDIWRENRRLRAQLAGAQAGGIRPGLDVGSVAPDFAVPDEGEQMLTLESLRAQGRPVALIFVAAGCGPCESLLPDLERLQFAVADRLTVGFVGRGSIVHYNRMVDASVDGLSLADAREQDKSLDQDLDSLVGIFSAYRIRGTPSAVMVSHDGKISSATVDGRPAIEALIRLALTDRGSQTDGLPEASSTAH